MGLINALEDMIIGCIGYRMNNPLDIVHDIEGSLENFSFREISMVLNTRVYNDIFSCSLFFPMLNDIARKGRVKIKMVSSIDLRKEEDDYFKELMSNPNVDLYLSDREPIFPFVIMGRDVVAIDKKNFDKAIHYYGGRGRYGRKELEDYLRHFNNILSCCGGKKVN